MNAISAATLLPESLDEIAVRHLCGSAVFAEADALQRGGHVLGAKLGDQGPEASVRGTWRRVDHVAVQVRAGRLHPSCSRDGEVFCRHVGALLLQCLRRPRSLAAKPLPVDEGYGGVHVFRQLGPPPNDALESPRDELARWLDRDVANHLRQIARRRGVKLSGSKKADIVAQLAAALAEPDNVDAALAGLGRGDLLALDAAHLMSVENAATPEAIRQATRALGGSVEPSLTDLVDAGLVAVTSQYGNYGPAGYTVPRVVGARLAPRGDLAQRLNESGTTDERADVPRLGIVALIQVIAQASLADRIHVREPAKASNPYAYPPTGFVFDPSARPEDFLTHERIPPEGVRLYSPRMLADADLDRLSRRIGQPVATVDFAVRLMQALDVAHVTAGGITVRFDHLQALLDLPAAERQIKVAHAGVATAGQTALDLIFGPGGALEVRWHQQYASWVPPFQPGFAAAARFIARLVGRMEPGASYDLTSFVDTVERLVTTGIPALVQLRASLKESRAITLMAPSPRGQGQRLAMGTSEAWRRFLAVVITAVLAGPLDWLGFVDIVARSGQPRLLHVRPEAGALVGRPATVTAPARAATLKLDDDLSVLVPPEAADMDIHGLLSRAGRLADASKQGLRYKLTPAGVQAVFDTGMSGPELAAYLADRAGGSLPAGFRDELDRLWHRFGTIRLYDEVTVVELSDDILLTELRAATSLDEAIVATFSPRLIAIDGSRADDVIAMLAERGYAPRVIEDH